MTDKGVTRRTKKRVARRGGAVVVRLAGICNAVACAPKSWSAKRAIEAAVAELGPSGTTGGWRKSTQRKLDDGTKLPAPCLDDPTRVHYLLEC